MFTGYCLLEGQSSRPSALGMSMHPASRVDNHVRSVILDDPRNKSWVDAGGRGGEGTAESLTHPPDVWRVPPLPMGEGF